MSEVYRTKSGKVLTESEIQALADEAEKGYDISLLKERALADDLADVFSHMVVGWKIPLEDGSTVDLAEHPEVQRVFARYREARK